MLAEAQYYPHESFIRNIWRMCVATVFSLLALYWSLWSKTNIKSVISLIDTRLCNKEKNLCIDLDTTGGQGTCTENPDNFYITCRNYDFSEILKMYKFSKSNCYRCSFCFVVCQRMIGNQQKDWKRRNGCPRTWCLQAHYP